MTIDQRFAHVLVGVEALIERRAEKAKAEIRAMGERNRRSLGQKMRHALRRRLECS